jgi:hypothetical protein
VNPRIPTDYREAARWLRGFAAGHAKRESPRIEAHVEMEGPREGRSFGLRLALGGLIRPPAEAPPIELALADVVEGRTRFAWCDALAQRIRAEARALVDESRTERTRSA